MTAIAAPGSRSARARVVTRIRPGISTASRPATSAGLTTRRAPPSARRSMPSDDARDARGHRARTSTGAATAIVRTFAAVNPSARHAKARSAGRRPRRCRLAAKAARRRQRRAPCQRGRETRLLAGREIGTTPSPERQRHQTSESNAATSRPRSSHGASRRLRGWRGASSPAAGYPVRGADCGTARR